MPYINHERRALLDPTYLDDLCAYIEHNTGNGDFRDGDMAYVVYRLLLAAAPRGFANFSQRNAMMGGVLEAVAEYRRRVHEPAEDDAITRNGDIL